MQNRTYAQLLDTIEALAGVDSFDPSSEEGKILSFVNRRAFAAYSASSVWERFIVVGEERSFRPSNIVVSGASEPTVNGVYKPSATTANLWEKGTNYRITWGATGGGRWVVEEFVSDSYYIESVLGTPVTTDPWDADFNTGEYSDAGVSVEQVDRQTIPFAQSGHDDIGEFNRIHRKQPFANSSALEYDFYVDADGAHVMNISPTDSTSVWVTYKKEFTDYTTSSTDIPFEWFEFLAHGAYADFLRMDGQLDAAMVEEDRAKEYLMWSLEKAQSRNNKSNIGKRIRTYGTTQRRG